MREPVLPLALAAALVAFSGAPGPEALAAAVEDAAWGLRFEAPEGWVRQPAPEGYLFVAPDQRGLLAVLPHEIATLDGKTSLDGRRWLRTCNPNDSVAEARPGCR